MFTVFMIATLVISFGLVIYRLPLLRSRHELDSWASREAAFLLNNWILLFAALFVLFATMFPTLSEVLMGERLTVGPPFFNKWMAPIGLILLFLTGVGPLLAWRKSTLGNMVHQFLWPVSLGLAVGIGVYAMGVRVWSSGLCFAFSAFVIGTIGQEFVRGTNIRRSTTGTDALTAMVGIVVRSRRRYGGYIVHVGIVLMFLGFAGEGFKVEEQVLLKPGQQTEVGGYVLRHEGVRVTDDGQKQMITGHVAVTKDGESVGMMYPAKWFFRKHEQEPTTEVAIRRSFAEDLYIVMPAFELQEQSATFEIVINPLVNWIWFGFGIMALGTGIALLPERSFAYAASKVPEGAATTSVVVLLAIGLLGAPVHAQHVEGPDTVPFIPRSDFEREMQGSIICMCGTCGRQLLSECTCGTAHNMRLELSGLVSTGMDRDQIFDYYIEKYGSQEPLAAPIDEGFNRLAWLFPYLVGFSGVLLASGVAVRWSRQRPALASAGQAALDPELEARLDDELRDLD